MNNNVMHQIAINPSHQRLPRGVDTNKTQPDLRRVVQDPAWPGHPTGAGLPAQRRPRRAENPHSENAETFLRRRWTLHLRHSPAFAGWAQRLQRSGTQYKQTAGPHEGLVITRITPHWGAIMRIYYARYTQQRRDNGREHPDGHQPPRPIHGRAKNACWSWPER